MYAYHSLILLIKHKWKKTLRSVALGRKIITGLLLGFVGVILLVSTLSLGFGLELLVESQVGTQDVVGYLNMYLAFFFISEIMYRMIFQKVSAPEIQNYLHLPIGRPKIIHFILGSSFISLLNLIPVLLFAPFAFTELSSVFGLGAALTWLATVVTISWMLHWLVLWFKHKYGSNLWIVIVLFAVILGLFAALYYGIFNVGLLLQPFLAAALQNAAPPVIAATFALLGYYLAYRHYRSHAYIEEMQSSKEKSAQSAPALFGYFGLAGELADTELRLILRHKKSRTYLAISLLFVAYGLWVYTDSEMIGDQVISFLTIFIGIFITGSFLINYGQFFLSWNSPYFDFFMLRDRGIGALIDGKYLIFLAVSLVCFILSIPYIYFAWESLYINTACLLFNVGVNVHVVMAMGLWQPQPIDLQEGNIFSMDGMGAAQLLMGIPIIVLPYLVYLPFSLLLDNQMGLAAVAITGIMGILFHEPLKQWHVNRLRKNRYKVAASFRQEL